MSRRQLAASMLSALGALALAARIAVWTFPLAAPAQEERFVTVDSGGLNLMHRGPIAYPREALEKNIQGPVVLEVSVNQKGLVYDARVLNGPDELRSAALQYVLQWHYSTTSSLPAKAQVTVNFQLPGRAGTEGSVEFRGRPHSVRIETLPPPLPDLGVLKAIEVRGLSKEAASALISKLPIREGNTITHEARERITQIVSETDEHLLVSYRRHPEGGTTLSIYLRNTPSPPPPAAVAGVVAGVPGGVPGGAVGGVIGGVISGAPPPPALAEPGPGRIRVGANVQAANRIESKPPQYPPLAKQARIQGTVTLEVLVGRDGRVNNITVVSGHPLLIPPTIEAVKEWVYRPTLLNGEPVEVITQVDVNFSLLEP